eukprot:1892-Heterococcus_DN1.PRE.1
MHCSSACVREHNQLYLKAACNADGQWSSGAMRGQQCQQYQNASKNKHGRTARSLIIQSESARHYYYY